MKIERESSRASIVSNSVTPWVVARQLPPCPWDSPGKNNGMGYHSLFQGVFLTQGSNPRLLHCRRILYHLSCQGSPENFRVWYLYFCPFCENLKKSDTSPNRLLREFRGGLVLKTLLLQYRELGFNPWLGS